MVSEHEKYVTMISEYISQGSYEEAEKRLPSLLTRLKVYIQEKNVDELISFAQDLEETFFHRLTALETPGFSHGECQPSVSEKESYLLGKISTLSDLSALFAISFQKQNVTMNEEEKNLLSYIDEHAPVTPLEIKGHLWTIKGLLKKNMVVIKGQKGHKLCSLSSKGLSYLRESRHAV